MSFLHTSYEIIFFFFKEITFFFFSIWVSMLLEERKTYGQRPETSKYHSYPLLESVTLDKIKGFVLTISICKTRIQCLPLTRELSFWLDNANKLFWGCK